MFGVFKKKIEFNICEHSNKLVSLAMKINLLQEGLNEQIRQNNRLVDGIKLLDRKFDLLAKHFQLEYKGGVFISKRK